MDGGHGGHGGRGWAVVGLLIGMGSGMGIRHEDRGGVWADMFNTTAHGEVVVRYIQVVKYFLISSRSGFLDMWRLFLCQFRFFDFPI